MQAQELRIGNYLTPEVKGVILKDELHIVEPTTLMMILGIIDNKEIKFKPIPLTEEWLLKCKSSEEMYGCFLYDRFKLIWKESYNFWYVIDRDNECYYTKIEFVHEWQNFVFAINGYELNFKN